MHLRFSDTPARPCGGCDPRPSKSGRDEAAAVRAETRTKLTVTTEEGDRVTISLASRLKMAAASHSDSDGTVQAVKGSSNTKALVRVDGNLSDAELGDLSKLIDILASLNPDTVLGSFSDLASLANFQYSQTQTIAVGTMFQLNA